MHGFFNVEESGTYSYHCALRCNTIVTNDCYQAGWCSCNALGVYSGGARFESSAHSPARPGFVGWGGGILGNLCIKTEFIIILKISEIDCLIWCIFKISIDLLIDGNLKCVDFKNENRESCTSHIHAHRYELIMFFF
jgi:hypothetical protein